MDSEADLIMIDEHDVEETTQTVIDCEGGANDSAGYFLEQSYRVVHQNASKLSSNRLYDPYRFKQVKSRVGANIKVQNKMA